MGLLTAKSKVFNYDEFILGFYGTAEFPSILFLELMAMLHNLQICWKSGFKRICFLNSFQSVSLI
jgi:hypothetical protein